MQPIVTPGSNEQDSKASWIRSTKRKWNSLTFKERIEILLATTIAICTLVMVGFGYWQASVSSDAVKIAADALRFQRQSDSLNEIEQRRTNDSSISVARRTIAIAESSGATWRRMAVFNEQSSKVQSVAYVALRDVRNGSMVVGRKFIIDVEVKNFGQTPAYEFSMNTGIAIGPKSIQAAALAFASRSRAKQLYRALLASGESAIFDASIEGSEITERAVESTQSGTWSIGLLVFVRYRDVWGKWYTPTFCMEYSDIGRFVLCKQ
jgi:hypothetical protein